jgi:hypothetical protein
MLGASLMKRRGSGGLLPLLLFSFCLGLAVPVAAQETAVPVAAQETTDDPVATARVHLGPLGLTPHFAIINVGIDDNVFNETSDPKRDFTLTVEPAANVWMRTGRGLFSLDGRLDLVYFNTYSSERSVNGFSEATYEYHFNRLRPYVFFSALGTRDRPGYDIDTRPRHFVNTFHTGVETRVVSKGSVNVELQRQTIAYASDAVYLGQNLANVLNNTLVTLNADWRQRLTPLTTLVVSTSREQDRFAFSPVRNSNSLRLNGGFELGRFALIRGSAFVGYRHLTAAEGSTLPDFSGVTANVSVGYTAPTQTRLSLGVVRDIQYSYDVTNPYYVQTGWTVGLVQRLIGKWEARLNGGQQHLGYRSTVPVPFERRDRVDQLGGGVGYAVNPETSIDFMVESYVRTSNQPGYRYQTIRSFGSVNYGF